MNAKTPQFNKAIGAVLKTLAPHKRVCKNCAGEFDIFEEDIEFYNKLQVPPPTLCPSCRLQRRQGWRLNFLPIFYKKTCSAPGHNEKVITYYSEDNPVKVYDDNYYLSDNWDGLNFGVNYDSHKSFFQQFNELSLTVPHQSLQKDPKNVNSDYVIAGIQAKDCYYVTVPYLSENVYYSYLPAFSKDSIDVSETKNSEKCYECVSVENCYNCKFCHESSDCLDSYFLYDCRNCSYCFGCTNLRNKQYCFFNEQLSKEEYERRIKDIHLGKRSVLKEYVSLFGKMLSGAIRKNVSNIKTENCFGDNIRKSKNCFYSFLIIGDSENLRYCCSGDNNKDSMDVYGFASSSIIYESSGVVSANNIKFSLAVRIGIELEYSFECNNCQYCFGCFGLKNKKYCIFNKQYDEDTYWKTVDEIKTRMLEGGDYGEFFPLANSMFPYQDSNAQVELPLEKEEIVKRKWRWEDKKERDIDLSKLTTLKAHEVPDDIADVSDEILKVAVICEETGKPFRITPFELEFYRKMNLPVPIVHPLQRMKKRLEYRRPFKLWQYPCKNCGDMVYTAYDPTKNLRVYCEKCYLAEIV